VWAAGRARVAAVAAHGLARGVSPDGAEGGDGGEGGEEADQEGFESGRGGHTGTSTQAAKRDPNEGDLSPGRERQLVLRHLAELPAAALVDDAGEEILAQGVPLLHEVKAHVIEVR
jgi:hypothetical protein